MKIFGLPLDNNWSLNGFSYSRWILPTYGCLSLILNLLIMVLAASAMRIYWIPILNMIEMMKEAGEKESRHSQYLEEICRIFFSCLIQTFYRHLMLSSVPTVFSYHVYVTRNWKNLWSNLLKIQEDMKLSKVFLKKCRRLCYFSLFTLILVCGTLRAMESLIY